MNYEIWKGFRLAGSLEMAFDTETTAVDLKKEVPDGVLMTAWAGEGPIQIIPVERWPEFIKLHLDRVWVGHNTAFDFHVVLKQLHVDSQGLISPWISLVEDNKMFCTMLLDGLVRIATGEADRGKDPQSRAPTRNLETLSKAYEVECAAPDKASGFRKRFGELLLEPDWLAPHIDPGFFLYAAVDCEATYLLGKRLLALAWSLHHQIPEEKLHPSHLCWGPLTSNIQMKASVALADISRRGVYIDLEQAWRAEARLRLQYQQSITWLEEKHPGLLQFTKEVKATKRRQGRRSKRAITPKAGTCRLSLKTLRRILQEEATSLGIDPPVSDGKQHWISTKAEDWALHEDKSDFLKHWIFIKTVEKQLGYLANMKKLDEDAPRLRSQYITLKVTGRTGCIAKGMRVDVMRDVSGDPVGIPIEEVKVGDYVFAYDNTLNLCLKKVLWAGKTGTKNVIRIHWQGSGHQHHGYLDLTPDHPVRLTNGEYVQACDLKPLDRVMALHRYIDKRSGYSRLFVTGQKKDIREHCFIHQHFTGEKHQVVHHWDGNKLNNVIENLDGTTNKDHSFYHSSITPREVLVERCKKAKANSPSQKGREVPSTHLNLSREDLHQLLEMYNYSVTNICKQFGIDFNTLKKYLKKEGYDLREIKEECKSRRAEQIKQSAAHARSCKKENNHEIIKIEVLNEEVDVYDLTVEDVENFIAEEICVHNCRTPNIQQTPKLDWFRAIHVPTPGKKLFVCDYSFIELRTVAYCCEKWQGFSQLANVIREGKDPHSFSAALMMGEPYDLVKKKVKEEKALPDGSPKPYTKMRQSAKPLNFGSIGGLGPVRLAIMAKNDYHIDMSVEEATSFLDKLITQIYPELNKTNGWLSTNLPELISNSLQIPVEDVFSLLIGVDGNFERLAICLDRVLRGCAIKADGTPYSPSFVKKLWAFGRVLLANSPVHNHHCQVFDSYAPSDELADLIFSRSAITPTGRIRRNVIYTAAKNAPFQSLAADGAKLALWNLWKGGFQVVAFIHDEILAEVDTPEQGEQIKAIMISSMQEVMEGFPVDVEGNIEDCWKK